MKTCLIVDDVTVSRLAARLLLEEMGFTIVEAADEEEALKALNEHSIDVVLLDWHLKKSSGLDTLELIREEHGDALKIFLFSGVEDEEQASAARAAGAQGYIHKPVTKDKIEAEFKNARVL